MKRIPFSLDASACDERGCSRCWDENFDRRSYSRIGRSRSLDVLLLHLVDERSVCDSRSTPSVVSAAEDHPAVYVPSCQHFLLNRPRFCCLFQNLILKPPLDLSCDRRDLLGTCRWGDGVPRVVDRWRTVPWLTSADLQIQIQEKKSR